MTLTATAQGKEALKLLGAVGRALAAVGVYDAAGVALAEAIKGWLEASPSGASYALCELLRIEGILGHVNRVRELWRIGGQLLPDLDIASRAHLQLAVGRALAQSACEREALAVLTGDSVDPHAPRHVQTAAHRWRAVAARALAEDDEVARSLARLERFGASDQLILARLDSEALDARQIAACLDELIALPEGGDEARRALNRVAPGLSTRAIAEKPEALRRCRAEYRY